MHSEVRCALIVLRCVLLLLQLCRSRRVGLRITKRHGLRDLNRSRALADRTGNRLALVIGTVNVWRNEEEDFAALLRNQFPLEEVAHYRNGSQTRCALASCTFGVCQHSAHHGGAAIGNKHFVCMRSVSMPGTPPTAIPVLIVLFSIVTRRMTVPTSVI